MHVRPLGNVSTGAIPAVLEWASYDYAVVRVVPRVDRDEYINAGVILFCRTRRYLAARVGLDAARLDALDPRLDIEEVERHLAVVVRLCTGGRDAGVIGTLSVAERFHWLVTPRSTAIQPSPVHSGLCHDPAAALDHLYTALVAPPAE